MSQQPVCFVNFAWPVYNTVRRKDTLLDELVHSCLVGITRLHIHLLCCHQNQTCFTPFYIFQKAYLSCLVGIGCYISEPLFRLTVCHRNIQRGDPWEAWVTDIRFIPSPSLSLISVLPGTTGAFDVLSPLGTCLLCPFLLHIVFQMWPKSMTLHQHLM